MSAGLLPSTPYQTRDQQTEDSVTSYTSVTNSTGEPHFVAGSSEHPWTAARVGERLRKAAALLEGQGGCDLECETTGKGIGIIGGIGVAGGRPVADAIVADAEEALAWLRWLEPDDARIVVARLDGAPWKAICWRFGISRPTADRRWRYALALIAWRLNGHPRSDRTPSLRALLGTSHSRGREP